MRPSSTPSPSSASSSRLTDEAPPLKRRRYSCRLRVSSSDFESGDDTVDLVTEEIVKNSLRAPTLCKFPRYEDEDDVDELDALTGPEEPLVHLNQTVILPPVLEAERRRRDECSDEEADENDDVNEVPSIGSHRAAAEDSEDELGIWGSLDESNSVSSIGNPAGNTSSHSQLAHPNVTAVTALQSRKSPRSTKIPSLHLSPVLPTHLPTPPQSDTPTFTDELLTPVTLVSPPSSPSPTKSKPKLGFERPKHSISRVRTRSQSRARSQGVEESPPRGRSQRSTRSLVTNPTDPVENLSIFPRPAKVKRLLRSSRSKSSPSPCPRPQHQRLLNSVNKRAAANRKGKGRVIDCGAEESDDPLRLPASPAQLAGGTSHVGRSEGESTSTFQAELLPSPSLTSLPRRKRRKKSSFENEDLPRLNLPIHSLPQPSETSPSTNKRRSSSDGVELNEQDSVRATPGPIPPYYPAPAFYPYSPYSPVLNVHPAMPLPDPRAQFIISQAMHQLSTLFTAPWPVQPATPPRHPSSAPKFSFSPHTPRHPFIFDSSASPGTLPTSSPPSLESSSRSFASSPLHRHGRTAKASLVPRSRSRGRHVSFQDDDVVGRRQRPARRQADDSGSFLELRRDSSGSCDLSEARIDVRPRARTPGPPVSPPSARRRHSGVASKTRDPI